MSIQATGNIPAITAQSVAPLPVIQKSIETASSTEVAEDAPRPSAEPRPAENTPESLEKALEDVRNALRPVANELMFSIDDDTGRTLVKIVDRETDEVIKQIPSEELLRISKALDKLQGLLVKQEV